MRSLGETVVGMRLIALNTCEELGVVLGKTSPNFKRLVAAVHAMDRFQALVRRHGPKSLHERRLKKEMAAWQGKPEGSKKAFEKLDLQPLESAKALALEREIERQKAQAAEEARLKKEAAREAR